MRIDYILQLVQASCRGAPTLAADAKVDRWIWGLQMNYSKQASSQIWNLCMMRTDCAVWPFPTGFIVEVHPSYLQMPEWMETTYPSTTVLLQVLVGVRVDGSRPSHRTPIPTSSVILNKP